MGEGCGLADGVSGGHWYPWWTPGGASLRFWACTSGFRIEPGCDWKEAGKLGASVRRRLGLAYAALGHKESAIREATKAAELMPVSWDALEGMVGIIRLAETYVMVGEYDAVIDQLDYLLSIPSFISVPLLRIDPLYDPLRDHPRFQTLLDRYDKWVVCPRESDLRSSTAAEPQAP